jgi:hypothetical protein
MVRISLHGVDGSDAATNGRGSDGAGFQAGKKVTVERSEYIRCKGKYGKKNDAEHNFQRGTISGHEEIPGICSAAKTQACQLESQLPALEEFGLNASVNDVGHCRLALLIVRKLMHQLLKPT